ncbi:MAG: hypothetical protein QOJ90_1954 [Actinomycetota bacterium]|nr:hypothetical protein [Actinomycetota bacterium]
MREPTRNRRAGQVLLSVAGLVLVIAYSFAGPGGLLLALSTVTIASITAVVLGVPAAPSRRIRPRRPVPVDNAPFRTYRHVAEQLSWAGVSPRHYDVVTRPMLQRVMASRLADRHGIDAHANPQAARDLVGSDLWPWLDPRRDADGSSRPPGLDPRTLSALVERLEAL